MFNNLLLTLLLCSSLRSSLEITDPNGQSKPKIVPADDIPFIDYPDIEDDLFDETTSCGTETKEFTEPEGKIKSPNGLAYQKCKYKIKVDIGKRILVKFDNYQTERGYDYITIYDGPSILSPFLFRLHGIDTDPLPFLSSTNQLFIYYTTDGSGNLPGFQLKYFAIDSNWTLDMAIENKLNVKINETDLVRFTTERGKITSPGYPGRYPTHTVRHYQIEVVPESRIEVKLEDFRTEPGYDYLEVFDGNSTDARSLAKYSGTKTNETLISTTNQLFMVFKSDSSGNKRGFKLAYRSVNESDCHWIFNSPSGDILSPNYPDNYTESLHCSWTINVPEDSVIIVTVNDIELANGDKLITNNSTFRSEFNKTTYWSLITRQFLKTDYLLIRLITDETDNAKGFNMSFVVKKQGLEADMLIFAYDAIIRERTDGTNETIYSPQQYSPTLLRSSRAFQLYTGQQHTDKIEEFDSVVSYDWVHNLFVYLRFSESCIEIRNASNPRIPYRFPILIDNFMSDITLNVRRSVILLPILGPHPHIEQCYYDGTGQHMFFSGKSIQGLAVDYQTERYFFIDMINNSLHSIDFEGKNELFYFKMSGYSEIKQMEIHNNDLYYMKYSSVYKHLELKPNTNLLETNTEIKLFDAYKYSLREKYFFHMILLKHHHKYPNKCEDRQCTGLCIPTNRSFKCICPIGLAVAENVQCPLGNHTELPSGPIPIPPAALHHTVQDYFQKQIDSNDNKTEQVAQHVTLLESLSNQNRNLIILIFVLFAILVLSSIGFVSLAIYLKQERRTTRERVNRINMTLRDLRGQGDGFERMMPDSNDDQDSGQI